MHDAFGWVRWLFSDGDFLTRNHCGRWSAGLVGVYVATHLLTMTCYGVVGRYLVVMSARQRDVRCRRLLLMGSIFFILCGAGHLGNVVVFWWAPYRFFTLLSGLSGLSGLLLVGVLSRLGRHLAGLSDVVELSDRIDQEMASAAAAREECRRTLQDLARLQNQVEQLRGQLTTVEWARTSLKELRELSQEIHTLLELGLPGEIQSGDGHPPAR